MADTMEDVLLEAEVPADPVDVAEVVDLGASAGGAEME